MAYNDGKIRVSDAPGLGVKLDRGQIRTTPALQQSLCNGMLKQLITLALFITAWATSAGAQVCEIKPTLGQIDIVFEKQFTRNGPGWTGADSTYSVVLPNGDSAFFFSDSYIAEDPPRAGDGTVTVDANGIRRRQVNCYPPLCDPPSSLFRANNSVVVRNRTNGSLRTLVGPRNDSELSTSFFSLPTGSPANHFFWVGDSAVVQLGRQKKLWVFLMEFDSKLAYHGSAIAQLSLPALKVESIERLTGTGDSTVSWGSALMLEGPVLYIYGLQNKQTINGKVPYLAKVDPRAGLKAVADTSRWRVWNGKAWVKGLRNAAQLLGAPNDPKNARDQISDEFSVKKLHTKAGDVYVLVGMDTTVPFGHWKNITLYSACRPEGLWSAKHVVYTTPEAESRRVPGMSESEALAGPMVVYNPHLHPQFIRDQGILISYNTNTSKGQDLLFADTYRPRFIRVRIEGLQSPLQKRNGN
ncbi:MAG TPA: hypothetical protein VGQ41_23415 [Pyrinomonadaceae bacterium]|nr:hypothetical protein [Pyrinomonadaceae bacterium]